MPTKGHTRGGRLGGELGVTLAELADVKNPGDVAPAEVAGISDRGLLSEDRPADVVVFDPETVGAGGLERVFDFPAGADRLIAREKGVRAVVVNGTVLRENGADAVAPDGDLPGGVLRNGQAAA